MSGSVSGLAAPFSCISGCSYSLSGGATQTVTIQFAPTAVGSFSDRASFSGGGGVSRSVSGAGTLDPVFSLNPNVTIKLFEDVVVGTSSNRLLTVSNK